MSKLQATPKGSNYVIADAGCVRRDAATMSEEPLYLVTGAGGFVGGFMVDLLRAEGRRVRAMIRDESQREALEAKGAEVVTADLREGETLPAAVEGCAGIFHIASLFRQAGLPESVFHDINAEGTRRLFDAAIAAGVPRIVHCSTVGVHGHVEEPPGDEETPFRPGDMYQRTKLEGEKIAMGFFEEGRVRGVVIRPAMIYGPGDTRTRKLFQMVARRRFFYVGKGEATVHWIDVRDLARSFLLAMDKPDLNHEVYIVAGATAVPLREMCALVADKLDVKPPWLHLPVKPMQWLGSVCETVCRPIGVQPPIFRRRVDFFTKSRHFDASKAGRDLGFSPAQDFSGELDDIIASYRESGIL